MQTDLVPKETKKMVLTAQQQANTLKVRNPDEAEYASALLKQIKEYGKGLTARKEEMTRPLMKSLASIRDLFKPLETDLADAEKITKTKLLAYNIEVEDMRQAEEARIAARVEKGTMKAETAANKLATMPVGKVSGVQTRILTKIRITDDTIIPREYMVPNMTMITNAVLREGITIPGVERYEEKTIAAVR